MFNKKKGFFLIEALILLFIVFSVCTAYLSQKLIIYYNADLYYLPILFQDLLQHGGNYIDWSLSPVPYFFPDWFIFFIAFIFTKQVYFQYLIVSCLNVLLIYVAIRLIYLEFFSNAKASIFSLISLTLFIFLAAQNIQPFHAVFLPTSHVGGFTFGLFYIWLQLRFFNKPSSYSQNSNLLFLAVLISFAVGISDLLYIVQFTFPVFLVYFLLFIRKKIKYQQLLLLALLPFAFSLFGGYLIKYVVHHSTLWNYALSFSSINKYSFSSIKYNINVYIFNFFRSEPFFIIVFFIFYIAILTSFIKSFSRNNKTPQWDSKINFLICFILFSLIVTFFSTGLQSPAIRFLYPFFYYPVLLLFCITYCFAKKINYYFLYITYLIGIVFLFLLMKLSFKDLKQFKSTYYPDDMACVDKALQNEGKKGIAQYWQAFPISMTSKQHLSVLPVGRHLNFFTFVGNINWFTKASKDWFSNVFSFAVIWQNPPEFLKGEIADENYIKKINGPPKKIAYCGDKKLLIYPKGKLRTVYFTKVGDNFTWLASELPSQFDDSMVNKTRQVKAQMGKGYLTFGPDIPLPGGQYRAEITYQSNGAPSETVAYWDLVSSKKGLLTFEPMAGTNNKPKKANVPFKVPNNSLDAGYQIRTYSTAKADLIIFSLKLIKIA